MKDTVSFEYSAFIRIYQPLRCASYSNYARGLNEAGDYMCSNSSVWERSGLSVGGLNTVELTDREIW